jgi:hypothetical protein
VQKLPYIRTSAVRSHYAPLSAHDERGVPTKIKIVHAGSGCVVHRQQELQEGPISRLQRVVYTWAKVWLSRTPWFVLRGGGETRKDEATARVCIAQPARVMQHGGVNEGWQCALDT